MRMLRWMCSKTHNDKITNGRIRRYQDVEPIEHKIREAIDGFGHVWRRPNTAPFRKCLN